MIFDLLGQLVDTVEFTRTCDILYLSRMILELGIASTICDRVWLKASVLSTNPHAFRNCYFMLDVSSSYILI